ncbi:hypothetical protein [Micromonospora chokoriensis]|uniref:Uncharacterized protein n=1 Tax=Micromonospora chokoriensis TaxID=356851 RepID=A0A1C4V9F9_9ACTN|nr:hypothetical protein [Micromonospora chokoriensis]SCE80670.1 hypothetical protein GA0070612_1217 [Micromonospora chokoriensis]
MELTAVLTSILVATVIISGLGVLFLMGYPSRFGVADRSEAERAAMLASDRRHHRLVNRGMSAVISIITGVLAVAILAGPSDKQSGGLLMAALSLVSAAVFVLLIRRDRKRPGG